jgi:ATP-dependent Lhr-like helicase
MTDGLDLFMPAVRRWFLEEYGAPTAPQRLGWPAIQRGEHTLILSPTGSGKTMAAFLWGLNAIFQDLAANPELSGVQLLYVSPLKALNNDIERNLRAPLAGIRRTARRLGIELPPLRVAVRTGDTPQSARQRMVKQPPHVLITTPESLYLILTSPRACEVLDTVKTVIVDEIHTLCGNKRGVHLGLSLERLTHRVEAARSASEASPSAAAAGDARRSARSGPQRIGLSATQRPLEEVARFLGGQEWWRTDGGDELVPRPVTIVDAGTQKPMDLRVITAVPDLRRLPADSIWPFLIPRVLDDVRRHRTTLIFANSRRAAERAADRLNEQYALEEEEEIPPGSPEGLLREGVSVGRGMFGTGRVGGPFRAHHGSVSREVRLELEQQLKAGRLPALIGTSSLELGIDIGTVDLVVQLQSPRSVARGLQRVGRSGHLVGQTSAGRIYATHREDLLDAGAVAHGMLRGDIEPTYTPHNCLDVLAQHIVAMVSMEPWAVPDLFRLVRQAYGYHNLSRDALVSVLDMLSGRYPSDAFRELRPRIAWDRVHDTLVALPGSRLLAITNGGTITDRGLFRVYLPDRKTLLGTLDEEFVFETHVGDVFTLGTGTWRVLEMDEDALVVGDAAGDMPRMPFWRGDAVRRDYAMGRRLGAFRRLLAERVVDLPPLPDDPSAPWPEEAASVIAWLATDYAMDEASARNAILYVRQQLDVLGAISSDRSVLVEVFTDAIGDQRMAIHSCFGSRVNSAWALVLAQALRERMRTRVETQVNDDGILFRFVDADREPPIDLVRSMAPAEARERLLLELPDSALFGAQFRMNAARALLLPGSRGGRRTPFWLQRLRAKDLLAVARQFEDFPIVAETYRDCLSDVLDLGHLMEVLAGIQEGAIRVVEAETIVPSPVAGSLLFDFINVQMYEGDLPKTERQMQVLALNRELLGQLLEEGALPDLLRPDAVSGVEAELQHLADGYQARSMDELAVIMHELGDLTADEVAARCLGEGRAWLQRLAADGRAFEVPIPVPGGQERRWIAAEDYLRYRDAFALPDEPPMPLPEELLATRLTPDAAREAQLRIWARTRGPWTRATLAARYAFPEGGLDDALERLVEEGLLATGSLRPGAREREWCDRRVLERIHRRTLSLLRREVQPVSVPRYAEFLAAWQGVGAPHRAGKEGLVAVMQQLRGLAVPGMVWERDLLLARVTDYRPALLDDLCVDGDLVWVATGSGDPRRARVRFLFRGEGALYLDPPPGEHAADPAAPATAARPADGDDGAVSGPAQAVLVFLQEEGASYAVDMQTALGLSGAELDAALVELALAGRITNDRGDALRAILGGEAMPRSGGQRITSSLDAQLATWRAARMPVATVPGRTRPPAERLMRARRDVARRLQRQPASPATRWSGRWSLVHRRGVWGRDVSDEERALHQARQLLHRYGVVTRECLANEEGPWAWPLMVQHLTAMEMRGEVRRGYFVRGLPGVQFALPEAVERLRQDDEEEGEPALVLLNACDPANLYGPAVAAARAAEEGDAALTGLSEESNPTVFARLPSNYVVLQRGVPILLYEHGGDRWKALPSASTGTLRRAVRLCLETLAREGGLCSQPRRVIVRTWNGDPPVGSPIQPLLEGLGFRREPPAMVWDGM